ncbi:MAG TPA: GNAT family N-acetyltransferase, partial [Humisphaera sp.]
AGVDISRVMTTLTLRPGRPGDADALADICYTAFATLNARHHFPPDFTNRDVATGLMVFLLGNPNAFSVVAEQGGRIVGSNFLWTGDPIAGVGPITVAHEAQGGVGRRLMEAVLARAAEIGQPNVRLVQSAFNLTSMSLYTKLGFDVREPLACMNGKPPAVAFPGYAVRPATPEDAAACADLCRRVHGHDRTGDLMGGVAQGLAKVVEHGGRIVAYTSDLGFFGHTVAIDNAGLMALIGGAGKINGSGFLLPSRNGEVFRWCLANGLRVVQPLTLMSRGLYNEPRGAFLPSILF